MFSVLRLSYPASLRLTTTLEYEQVSKNPLLDTSGLPHGAFNLAAVKPSHFLPAIRQAIGESQKKITLIRENPEPATFENTVEALEFSKARLVRLTQIFSHFYRVANDEALEKIAPEVKTLLAVHQSETFADQKLFNRVRQVYESAQVPEQGTERHILLQKTYKSFVRNGALLPPEQQAELMSIEESLARKTSAFSLNVTRSAGAFVKVIEDENALSGLPDRLKAAYSEEAEKRELKGKWAVTLLPRPDEILAYAEDRALRREIYIALNSTAADGPHDNRDIMTDILWLRHRKARLLGYANYADFVLDDRMAGKKEKVLDFLESIEAVYKPAMEKHLMDVKDFAKNRDGVTDFQPWDFEYYSRLFQELKHGVKEEDLCPYLELESVLKGLCSHVEKFFDVKIEETSGKYPVYDQDVRAYEISDGKSGKLLGIFYGDFFARPAVKTGGAYMDFIRERGLEDGEDKCPMATLTLNMQKPVAGQPALLSVQDVMMVSHEFGHVLHSLLGEGRYPSLTGTHVVFDMLELPSQFLEEQVMRPDVLADIAVHYQTGEKPPPGVLEKALAIENQKAVFTDYYYNYLSFLDLACYMTPPEELANIMELEEEVTKRHWMFPVAGKGELPRFGHVFEDGEYPASFYSYNWTKAIAASLLEKFGHTYDPELAKKMRDNIYAKGGTEEAGALLKRMTGSEEVNPKALLRKRGLTP